MSSEMEISMQDYRMLLRYDFRTFLERAFHELNSQANFISGRYIDLLAATLEKCRTGKTKRLILNLPPRTLKSHAASVAYPAWLLGHDPAKQIICASYGQDLADKHARDCRTLMSSAFYRGLFPRTVLSSDRVAVNDFLTTAQGVRMATSVNGVLTGRGADILILDDILKPDDALSETRRKSANEWYFNTLLSRLNSKDHGVIIIVMQRLHEDDLVGVVTEAEPWEVLSLPAIAEEDECIPFEGLLGADRFVRKAGEALHPERDSVETYHRIRESVGEYIFQSQYQQRPVPREGGLIKRQWLRYYKLGQLPATFDFVLQSWDTASKAGEMNDYSVGTTWGLSDGKIYLLEVFRWKVNFPELKRAVIDLYRKYNPSNVLIEDKASGTALIQELKSGGIYGVECYRPEPGSDKMARFAAQAIKFEAGQILLPDQAPWLEEYVREITGFPGTKYDDQVDSTSQALAFLATKASGFSFLDALVRMCPPRVHETC